MTAAMILHHMIIEHECGQDLDYSYDLTGRVVHPCRRENRIQQFLQVHQEIRDADTHQRLQQDLIEEW